MTDTTLLSWINAEVDRALTLVQESIAKFAAAPDNDAVLQPCPEHLHQVAGALRMVGLTGATRVCEAIDAMERSTQGVVQGTKTADEADQALREIGTVSRQLAELIESISAATQQQAASAGKVASNMKVILGITQLTTDGTKQTATSAARLTALAVGLKSSVAGFKLAA